MWRGKGDNSREREKRRKTVLFKQTLKVMFYIITSLYESCFTCRTLISNSIDRCFGQPCEITSKKSVVGGANNHHYYVRAINKNQTLLEIYAAIAAMLDSN